MVSAIRSIQASAATAAASAFTVADAARSQPAHQQRARAARRAAHLAMDLGPQAQRRPRPQRRPLAVEPATDGGALGAEGPTPPASWPASAGGAVAAEGAVAADGAVAEVRPVAAERAVANEGALEPEAPAWEEGLEPAGETKGSSSALPPSLLASSLITGLKACGNSIALSWRDTDVAIDAPSPPLCVERAMLGAGSSPTAPAPWLLAGGGAAEPPAADLKEAMSLGLAAPPCADLKLASLALVRGVPNASSPDMNESAPGLLGTSTPLGRRLGKPEAPASGLKERGNASAGAMGSTATRPPAAAVTAVWSRRLWRAGEGGYGHRARNNRKLRRGAWQDAASCKGRCT
jgi:hypothetical protein